MIKVLVTKKLQPDDVELVEKGTFGRCELIFPEEYNEEGILSLVEDVDVLFGNVVTEKILQAAKRLKLIQIPWTGVDFLDFELLKKFNIPVCNSHSNALVVAEHAVSMMFAIAKKLTFHDKSLRNGIWNRIYDNTGISPFSEKVTGSDITIVGYGAIGQVIKKLIVGFNAKIKIVDPIADQKDFDDVEVFKPENIESALSEARFVFIAVPLTDETKCLVNDSFIGFLNKASMLINISRGEVIDEKSLYNALKENKIQGAAIDTWFNYPNPNNKNVLPSVKFPFHELNNLVMSPHRAGYIAGELPHLDDAIENVNRLADQKPLINKVSLYNKY